MKDASKVDKVGGKKKRVIIGVPLVLSIFQQQTFTGIVQGGMDAKLFAKLVAKRKEVDEMKCIWPGCGGFITKDGRCLQCGRSTDLEYERSIYQQQHSHKHRNLHDTKGDVPVYHINKPY